MSRRMQCIVLIGLLFLLSSCKKATGEATVKVNNQSAVQIHVDISGVVMQIGPGQTGTFALSWDGGGSIFVSMVAYPVGEPLKRQTQTLELSNDSVITVNVKF